MIDDIKIGDIILFRGNGYRVWFISDCFFKVYSPLIKHQTRSTSERGKRGYWYTFGDYEPFHPNKWDVMNDNDRRINFDLLEISRNSFKKINPELSKYDGSELFHFMGHDE